jgi:hypothetical protein
MDFEKNPLPRSIPTSASILNRLSGKGFVA